MDPVITDTKIATESMPQESQSPSTVSQEGKAKVGVIGAGLAGLTFA